MKKVNYKNFDVSEFFKIRSVIDRNIEDFKALMDCLGNPQDAFMSVQVAGTNAKGSTCAFLGNILSENTQKVAVFSSPALISPNERFLINGEFVKDQDLQKAAIKVSKAQEKIKIAFGGFDLMCATAFVLFEENGVEIAILETGIGGRLDPTNIVKNSVLSIITPISLDHTKILGETIKKIASEKSYIIKKSQKAVIILDQQKSVQDILIKKAEKLGVKYILLSDCKIITKYKDLFIQEFLIRYKDEATYYFETQMMGEFQQKNACAAFLAAKELGCDAIAIQRGISTMFLPARMEMFLGNPDVMIDGAHNPAAIDILLQTIQDYFPEKNIILITSIMQDKDYVSIINKLCIRASYVISVGISDRSVDPEILAELAKQNSIPAHVSRSFQQAFVEACSMCDDNDLEENNLVLVAGSLYLAGAFRAFLVG